MRRLTVAAILTAALVVPAFLAAHVEGKPPCLILYAFNEEGSAIAAQMTVTQTDTILGRVVLSGVASGRSIVVAESGVGMTNAAMTAQRLIDQYHPVVVIFTGIAGAIDSSVHIGDIVIASSWVQHDFGYIGAEGFKLNGIRTFDPHKDGVVRLTEFPVDSLLLSVAQGSIIDDVNLDSVGIRKPAVIVGGVGASGNTFIDSREKRDWLSQSLNAKVVDMESAAVVQVCIANGIPVIVMRSASDLAGGSGSSTARVELDRFFKIAAKNSATLALRLLEHLTSLSRGDR
jgi:adenosylhomocysteine nucleosidase